VRSPRSAQAASGPSSGSSDRFARPTFRVEGGAGRRRSDPRPGEISLAHNGVLFLDELPNSDNRVLESLREPLESGRIAVCAPRARPNTPPLQLIAAMNPCPCATSAFQAPGWRSRPTRWRATAQDLRPLLDSDRHPDRGGGRLREEEFTSAMPRAEGWRRCAGASPPRGA